MKLQKGKKYEFTLFDGEVIKATYIWEGWQEVTETEIYIIETSYRFEMPVDDVKTIKPIK